MQNKGTIRFFAIAFALVSLFQLSFTLVTAITKNRAEKYATNEQAQALAKQLAKNDALLEVHLLDSIKDARTQYYLDSVANQPVYNVLLRKYTYKECMDREINLGLDLKGGMNVTMAVSVPDVIRALSGYNQDPTFLKSLQKAIDKEKTSTRDFVDLFAESFKETDPNAKMAAIFNTVELKDKINYNSTNDEVIKVIRDESNSAIDRTYNILTTRIDRFGVVQPNIQRLQTAGRILIELPGIKDPERVRKLLQGTAQLEFWETYQFPTLQPFFTEANTKLTSILSATRDTIKADSALKSDTAAATKAIASKQSVAAKTEKVKKADSAKADTSKDGESKKEGEGEKTDKKDAQEGEVVEE